VKRFLKHILIVLLVIFPAFAWAAPGTQVYTVATNLVTLVGGDDIGGTSGNPYTFTLFKTYDDAGTGTVLLSAGTPASDLALTYAVRPVEYLAIVVKCIVANKTPAQTDYIFITGKDFKGDAQTEAIDVTAGNDTYTSTKYWASITNLDCSDNAAGGGTVWADGTIAVTQDIWGVVWDLLQSNYQIDSIVAFGNGSTATFFKSTNETIYFADTITFGVVANATLQLGNLTGVGGVNGVYWSIGANTDWYNMVVANGTFNIYGSLMVERGYRANGAPFVFWGGIVDIRNSTLQHSSKTKGDGAVLFYTAISSLTLIDVIFRQVYLVELDISPTVADRITIHDSTHGLYSIIPATLTKLEITSAATNQIRHAGANTLTIVDSVNAITQVRIDNAAGVIRDAHLCDINITDKDGNNLSGAIVACVDQYNTSIFSVLTDVNGNIAQQTIIYKQWATTAETLTTYSPHKFTLSKAGYETLVLDNITVDGPVDWHLELQSIKRPRRFQTSCADDYYENEYIHEFKKAA